MKGKVSEKVLLKEGFLYMEISRGKVSEKVVLQEAGLSPGWSFYQRLHCIGVVVCGSFVIVLIRHSFCQAL